MAATLSPSLLSLSLSLVWSHRWRTSLRRCRLLSTQFSHGRRTERRERGEENNFDQIVHHYHHCHSPDRSSGTPMPNLCLVLRGILRFLTLGTISKYISPTIVDFNICLETLHGETVESRVDVDCGWLWEFGCALSERKTTDGWKEGWKEGWKQTIRAKKWRLDREEREEIPDQSMTSVTKKRKRHQTLQELIALKQILSDCHYSTVYYSLKSTMLLIFPLLYSRCCSLRSPPSATERHFRCSPPAGGSPLENWKYPCGLFE